MIADWQNIQMDGNQLRDARKAAGLTLERVAGEVGLSVSQISRIETGTREPRQVDVERMLALYGQPPPPPVALRSQYNPPPAFLGERDLPIYAAAEGGSGAMVVYTDAIDMVARPWYVGTVKDAYGVLVVGDSMDPAFRAGEIAVVHPRLQPQPSQDIILVRGEEHGAFDAIIKFLIKQEQHRWYVRQYNPRKDFWLDKKEWPKALRVVGKAPGV